MKWREDIVSKNLDVKGKTITILMSWYHEHSLIVNRKYQRKLVWDLEEQRLFIDSIINKYPTPSIIVSSFNREDENGEIQEYYEIIDGLQRLNAIVSFVENRYGIIIDGKEYFYDMQFIPTALTKKLCGELRQREPKLDFKTCQEFSFVEIPIIVTSQIGNREEKIERIFERINSSGKKLSAHDIRQASSAGEFSDLVRRVAADFRGDFTYYDEIDLCDMPKISLKSEGLDYGIDPEETFWRKHDIIPFNNFRRSKDEEIIESALAVALLGEKFRINSDNLDYLYKRGTEYSNLIEQKIDKIGKDTLEEYAKNIINQIDNIFDSVDSNFTDYLYPKKTAAGKDISFIILFCVLYQLNRESYFIEDYVQVANVLKAHFASTFDMISKSSKHENRIRVMNLLYALLKSTMVKTVARKRTSDEDLVEKLLSLSTIEMQMVEFKIGITYFENGKINNKEIEKIWHTLVAMANTDCAYQHEGYVIIGIANNRQSCKNWKDVYGETPLSYGSHKIVGITKEATTYFFDEDRYELEFGNLIKNSLISEPLKTYVLSNYRMVDFSGKTLMLLPSVKQNNISYYGNEFYVREGTRTSHKKDKDRLQTTKPTRLNAF